MFRVAFTKLYLAGLKQAQPNIQQFSMQWSGIKPSEHANL